MNETTTLGPYLKRERERRGLTLRTISETTKVSVALLEGLESDDVSRWPGGIFRRAFVRSYAQCVGLDADEVVRRFEQQHQPPPDVLPGTPVQANPSTENPGAAPGPVRRAADVTGTIPSQRARLAGTAADLGVAMIVAFGSAAAGSRLLWPVLLIAAYYATGVLLTGTSPMVALLGEPQDRPGDAPAPQQAAPPAGANRSNSERRHHSRRHDRSRHRRGVQARAQ